MKTRAARAALAALFALSLAACAQTPPPSADYSAPPRKCDAKTQLETGRKNC